MFYSTVINPLLENLSCNKDSNAFCISESFYSYGTLAEYISKIRIELKRTTHHNQKIGLVVNDDIETYASIFAIWLEGECYIPLHPNWPIERCLEIIAQVEIDLILDSSKQTRYSKCNIVMTTELAFTKMNLNPKQNVSENDLAYILFTSGSTGKPKGVQLMRKNVGSFMDSFWKTGININNNDRCLQAFDLTFDVSVQNYLIAVTRGACIYTIPHNHIKYVYASSLIEDHKLTFASMAPSMLRYLQPYFSEIDAKSLKTCILTAEACPLDLMEDWYNCATNTEIYDFYGPTEATIYCTYYKLTKNGVNKSLNGIISIGKPLDNVLGLILDEQANEVPRGVKGELCVAGDQVTLGYWMNSEKNESAFFNKIIDGQQVRFYHTGDLCYEDSDGDIMYSGRLDHQAKIQGYRVEMGEIEFHAREFLGGTNVVCLPFDNEESLTEIAMFIEKEEFITKDLIAYMRTKMPAYMIPTRIFFVSVFKLNSNDKVDKTVLKAML